MYRSRSNRKVMGVCGGLAEYLGVDAAIVRIIWVLVALSAGAGVLAYIVAAVVLDENPTP